MKNQLRVRHKGIVITVAESSPEHFSVYFENEPGNFEPLENVKALHDFRSQEEGIEAGKVFVDDRQWKFIIKIGLFELYVRLWWNGRYGYSVRSAGSTSNSGDFATFDEAKDAGIARAREKISELNQPVQNLKK